MRLVRRKETAANAHADAVRATLTRTARDDSSDLAASIAHLTAKPSLPPNLVTAAIGFDTNAVFALIRSRSAPVIDFLATQHRGPLVIPGQVLVELWNQREDLPEVAARISKTVAELEKLLHDASHLIPSDQLQQLVDLVKTLSWSETTSLSDAQERLRLLLDVVNDRGIIGRVPRDQFHGIGRARMDAKVPPGFEDRRKDRGDLGDFYVWADFLIGVRSSDLGSVQDVVFVTNDAKQDWRTTSGRPHPILCAEVATLFGSSLCLLKYSEFRDLCPE